MQASITCRTIRIGTHKFESKEKVSTSRSKPVCSFTIFSHPQLVITTKGIRIVAPTAKEPKESIVLNIMHSEVVKVITHFSKQLHIIFLYAKPSCGRYIVDQLQLSSSEKDKGELSILKGCLTFH